MQQTRKFFVNFIVFGITKLFITAFVDIHCITLWEIVPTHFTRKNSTASKTTIHAKTHKLKVTSIHWCPYRTPGNEISILHRKRTSEQATVHTKASCWEILFLSWFLNLPEWTSTLSQRKGRAPQPSITWEGGQPARGWGGGPPRQRQRRRDSKA